MSKYGKMFSFTLFFLVIFIFTPRAENAETFNSIRIAYFHFSFLNDALLNRIKNSQYNYAVVVLPFRISNDSVGDGDVYTNLQTDICSLCVALDEKGIRLIPLITMSSRWALQWKILQQYENPHIGMNTITANENLPNVLGENPICSYTDSLSTVNFGSNSWAPEPEGVDKSVLSIFTAIREGFKDAKVDYPLEFVHIQHDEPQFLNWLLMAGVGKGCGNTLPYRGNFARGEVSDADVSFISSALEEGHSLEEAYQRLLANELYRRVTQAEEVFGSNVRLMFYAESFDDQSWGGVPWHVAFGDSATIQMHNAITLPGLDEEQQKAVKRQTIPMLWNYDGKNPFVANILNWLNRKDYDSEAAFKRFVSHGFQFIYIGALQNGNDSKNQIVEYASAAKKYKDYCLGYFAAAWVDAYDSAAPDEKWDIIEYMPSVQNSTEKESGLLPHSSTRISISVTENNSRCCAISFSLVKRDNVSVAVYTSSGRQIKTLLNQTVDPGNYSLRWKLNPGLYLVRMLVGNRQYVKSITVMK